MDEIQHRLHTGWRLREQCVGLSDRGEVDVVAAIHAGRIQLSLV